MLCYLLLGPVSQRGTRGELGSSIKRSQLISNFYDFCVCDSVDWDEDRIDVLGAVM